MARTPATPFPTRPRTAAPSRSRSSTPTRIRSEPRLLRRRGLVLANGQRREDPDDDGAPDQRREDRLLHRPRIRLDQALIAEQLAASLHDRAQRGPLRKGPPPARHGLRWHER